MSTKSSKITLIIFTILLFSTSLYSQISQEVGLDDRDFAASLVNSSMHSVKIYQATPNSIKFEVPDVDYAKISIYDGKSNLIRTYLFNNLREGIYEISTPSGNFKKGKYNCVLQTENTQENSIITIY